MEEQKKEQQAPLKNVYQRILGVMGDIDYIQKGDKKVNGQYSFVSHDAVTAALHPLFVKHGLVVIPTVSKMEQDGNRTEIMLDVHFINADIPEQMVRVQYPGFGIDNSDKGIGKAISYAFKYACLKTFSLETGDDPDQDVRSVHVPKKPISVPLPIESDMTLDQLHKLICDDGIVMMTGITTDKIKEFLKLMLNAKDMNPQKIYERMQKHKERFIESLKNFDESGPVKGK